MEIAVNSALDGTALHDRPQPCTAGKALRLSTGTPGGCFLLLCNDCVFMGYLR